MSKFEKALARLKTIPRDYTYDEYKSVLEHLGFKEEHRGKTSGSAVAFRRESDNRLIMIHKPHPGKIIKTVYVKRLYDYLKETGEV